MRFSKHQAIDVSPSGEALFNVTITEPNGYHAVMLDITENAATSLQNEVNAGNLAAVKKLTRFGFILRKS